MRRVAFATASKYPELTSDERRVIPAFRALGMEVEPLTWDETSKDLTAFDAIVIRSCWDYHHKTPAFKDWLAKLDERGLRVFNSPRTCLWNLDKAYLREVKQWTKGTKAALPETVWLEAGIHADLGSVLRKNGLREAVIKPLVSMNGDDTWRVTRETAAALQPELDRLLANRALMLQEFVPEVLTEGEVSLVFLGGEFSHAIRKTPRSGEFRIHQERGGSWHAYTPSTELVAIARELLAHVREALLFARVDGIPSRDAFKIMELELIDPMLYFEFDAEAPGRFARGLEKALSGVLDSRG